MNKLVGLFALFVVVCLDTAWRSPEFASQDNIYNLLRWTGLYGIIGIGVAFVIITGGIDLSIGSMISLTAVVLAKSLNAGVPWPVAVAWALALTGALGLLHGLLVTKLHIQPFVVTLFGLLFYRGIARYLTNDNSVGFGAADETLKSLVAGRLVYLPAPFVLFMVLAVVAAVFLNHTIYGRYLLALGRNEQAARYSGIRTDRMVILAYVICGLAAGFAGVLFAVDIGSIQPGSHGNFYELYAIAAAVLGGCSLRGGEGSIVGVALGTALMRVLLNATNIRGMPQTLEFAIVGSVILATAIVDEVVRRVSAKRRTVTEAALAERKA